MTDKKICPNCGAEISIEATFCPKCGTKNETKDTQSNDIEIIKDKTIKEIPETKYCNNCGAEIDKNAKICPKCGVRVAGVNPSQEKNPTLALVLSFLLCGLGQIYNGETTKGIIMIIALFACACTTILIIPAIILFILWIYGMIDAYDTAKKINNGEI